MVSGYILSGDDVAVLKKMVDWFRKSGHGLLEDEGYPSPYQSPDTYVALLPDGGIAALSGSTPGAAECDIYRLIVEGTAGSLATMNMTRLVFNLSSEAVTGSYVPVTRTKSGAWIITSAYNELATGTASCTSSLDGITLLDLDTDTSPGYVLGLDSSGCLVKIEVGTC